MDTLVKKQVFSLTILGLSLIAIILLLTTDFGGFWNRFIALVIDIIVVSLIVFPFALVVGLVSPNYILVEVPFDLASVF